MDEGLWELEVFLHLIEKEVGGRLAPTAEQLATKAFEKTLEVKLGSLADAAMKHGLEENDVSLGAVQSQSVQMQPNL